MVQASYLLLLTAHLLASAAVTIHVLLNKRNVQSAIGWIGLAWLTPFIGAGLYFAFGINRVQRRALTLRRSSKKPSGKMVSDTSSSEPFSSLKITIGALTQQNLMNANISMPLHDGDDAYPLMLAAIHNAKATIALSSYIFRSDRIGHEFIDALSKAVQRGVLVRVLIDGFGGGIFSAPTFHAFHTQNVPVARFMYSVLPWKMQFLNLRLHKKILVIDGATAFVGGLNIADENTTRRRQKIRVRDTHFKISGSVVGQITSDFINDWLFATGEKLDESIWNPQVQKTGTVPSRVIVSGPDQETDKLSLVLFSAISAAQKSIKIATPYFLPGDGLMTALQLAAIRGVDVQIVIPQHSNYMPMDWAMNAHVSPLLLAGCRIAKAPLPFDHSKLMIVDSTWCLFGSPNWDTRSLRLNFEIAIEAYDPKLAAQLSSIIEQSSVTPLKIEDLETRSIMVKCRDAATRLLMPYL